MEAREVLLTTLSLLSPSDDKGPKMAVEIILADLDVAGLGIRPREPTPAMRKAGLRHKARPGSWEAAWDAGRDAETED